MPAAGEIGYWLYWGLGLVFLLACGALTWWGLFGDRARGRRRCPGCWYDLSHTDRRLCPECGHTARSERQLHRSRRRLLPAAAGALIASLGVAWVIEQQRHSGWMSIVPSGLLMVCLPLADGPDSVILGEIEQRGARRQFTASQWQSIADRCLSGDRWARPVTRGWQQKYGRLLELVETQAMQSPGLSEALLELPPWIDLQSDRAWPAGVPPCLDLQLRHWWPDGTECRLELTPGWSPAEPMIFTRTNARSRTPCPLVVPVEEAARGSVRFDAVVKRRAGDDEWQTVLARPLDVPIALAPEALDETIAADTDSAILEVMREVFNLGVVQWRSGPSPMRVRFEPRHTFTPDFEGLAIGARVEIRRDGELARRLDLWWLGGPNEETRGWGYRVDYENSSLVSQAVEGNGEWQMTVRGEPSLAYRAGRATRYWSGEFTIPLKVERGRRTPPTREWEATIELDDTAAGTATEQPAG